MKISRREILFGSGVAAGALSLSGCNNALNLAQNASRKPIVPPSPKDELAVAMLNRFGFGPNTESLQTYRELGYENWIEHQLNPRKELPTHLNARIGRLEIYHLGPWDLRDWKEEAIISQMQQNALLRATYSPWQLEERMVDFWSNHFNIFAKKGLSVYRKPFDEMSVIRKHALGKFSDMVAASAQSTAMLLYLDQQNSTALHPNENYARELLELHTLGVNGGYTQKDVMEVARCFTGWSEERGFLKKKGAFKFIPEIHDQGEKFVLGHKIPANQGVKDGLQVVNIVSHHPSTAKHISSKLCEYFLGNPQHNLQSALENKFLESDGNIKEMMRLIMSNFPNQSNSIIKRPFDYVVSALRACDASTDCGLPIQSALATMGQPLYLWPMPDGFPVETESWTSSLLSRWNFASQLAKNSLGGTRIDPLRLVAESQSLTGIEILFRRKSTSSGLKGLFEILKSKNLNHQIALGLSSQEFQWR